MVMKQWITHNGQGTWDVSVDNVGSCLINIKISKKLLKAYTLHCSCKGCLVLSLAVEVATVGCVLLNYEMHDIQA